MTPNLTTPPPGGQTPPPEWYEHFAPFGVTHLVVVVVAVALIIWSCRRGRSYRDDAAERRLVRNWVLFIVCTQIVHIGYWLQPGLFNVRTSLPVQVCDIAPWIAAAALGWNVRWARTLLYFWGIGLSTQAFFTPVLLNGVGTLHFWLFWITHLQIVGSAIYDVAARGYRPTGRDYLVVTVANLVYAGIAMALNIAFDANYGFMGNTTPQNPTLIDSLGEWPLRVVWVILIAQSGMLVMWLVWAAARRIGGRTREPVEA